MTEAVGVDVGGTFTDFVVVRDGSVNSFKVATSSPQSESISEGMATLDMGHGPLFIHGTTVGTNALLEMSGAKVAFVSSAGFEDLVEIGRQNRPSLYDQAADRPDPLVSRHMRLGHRDQEDTIQQLSEVQPEAVAIGLMASYEDDTKERQLGLAVEERFPAIPVSLSQEVSPGFREYERFASTILDAYLTPVVLRYLGELASEIGIQRAYVLTSAGALLPIRSAKGRVGQLALSGPAGGVVATDALRRHHGFQSVISFDMGGTSTDVARIGSDGPLISNGQTIGGRFNRVPSMPIHTVGAGGGSIAWIDEGGALRVGPQSAGANPGPASYGLGGVQPTVTDANVYLGYIPESSTLSPQIRLDRAKATEAIGHLAERLSMTTDQLAQGILAVADAHMERAIRRVSVEEGFDPGEASLVAFGGAGGLHALRLARSLGMASVLVPPHPGAFSALGLLMANPRVEVIESVLVASDSPEVEGRAEAVGSRALQSFLDIHRVDPVGVDLLADVRYAGQSHELTIAFEASEVAQRFEVEHQLRFGFVLDRAPVEIVNLRGVAIGSAPFVWDDLDVNISETARRWETEIHLSGKQRRVDVVERASMRIGMRREGPCLILDETGPILVGEGDSAEVLDDGTLEITW